MGVSASSMNRWNIEVYVGSNGSTYFKIYDVSHKIVFSIQKQPESKNYAVFLGDISLLDANAFLAPFGYPIISFGDKPIDSPQQFTAFGIKGQHTIVSLFPLFQNAVKSFCVAFKGDDNGNVNNGFCVKDNTQPKGVEITKAFLYSLFKTQPNFDATRASTFPTLSKDAPALLVAPPAPKTVWATVPRSASVVKSVARAPENSSLGEIQDEEKRLQDEEARLRAAMEALHIKKANATLIAYARLADLKAEQEKLEALLSRS